MRFPVLVSLLLLWLVPAQAQEALSPEDAAAVRNVIQSQLDAFNRDDGNAAFGFAAPAIQARFQTVETFMAMVRTAYSPVYRSAAAEFGLLSASGDHVIQEVVVTGQDGQVALAVYRLGRQPDGSCKIEGVTLQPLPDLNV